MNTEPLFGQWVYYRVTRHFKAKSWLVLQGHDATGKLRAKNFKKDDEVSLSFHAYDEQDGGRLLAHGHDGILRDYSADALVEVGRDESYPAWKELVTIGGGKTA